MQNENYYIARCNNKVNSTCRLSKEEYKEWNGKCTYGKDGGVYCTAKWKLELNNENNG